MNTIEIYLTSVGENQEYSQNFSFAELIKDFPIYQGNYQNIVLNINIPTSILPSGYAIAGVTTNTMGVAVKVNASSLAPNGMVRQSKSFYLRYIKTYTKDNVEYAMFQRPFPQTFSLYAGQGENAPKLTINVVNIMNDTLMEPNPTVVSLITSQTCSLEIMPSTILDKDAQLDPTDLEEINARLTSIEEEQLIQNTDIDTNEENIADLDLRVTANEDDIADLQDKVEALGGTPFTNEKMGLILGSADNGKISANADGTGSVNGWDTKLDKNLGTENSGKYLKVNNEGAVQPTDLNIKTLNTDNASAQETSSSETIMGSGTINLHKVAKTGTYSDLIGKPTLGTASALDTGTAQGNIPVLGANGKLPSSVVPASAITETFVVSSQADMLALSTAQKGDVCVRTDLNKSFILKAEPYSTLANWQELLTPTDAVLSVNGQTGAVSLSASDVGAEAAFNKNTAFNQNFETSTSNIKMNGSVNVGSSNNIARADHIHPSDTSKQDVLSATNKLSADYIQDGSTNKVFTATEQSKLSGIAAGAEVNVQADWNQTNSAADDFIKNKPNIPAGVVVDTTLDTTSNNAISNSAVATEFNKKVDKTSSGNRLYGTDNSGNQTTISYTTADTANTIPIRTPNGDVLIALSPALNNSATPKKYVDDADALKVDKTTSTNKIYATDNSGNQTTKSIMKLSSVDALGWEYGENHTKIPELSALAYWNGAYEQQLSNLQYCKDGEIASKDYVKGKFNAAGFLSDMNTVVTSNKVYWTNQNTTNIPNNDVAVWGTVVYNIGASDASWFTQLYFPNEQEYFYRREYVNGAWKSWKQISTMALTTLYSGNSTGTYSITDISNFKFLLLALKTSSEWVTTIYPVSQALAEINNNIPLQIVAQDNNPNDYKYVYINFNSTTSINIGANYNDYIFFWGIK